MIVRTEAVVLRAMDYGETSQIVSLFTRQQGRVSVLARGARRPKSRFGSALQPMSYVQAIYFFRPQRELQTLTEASHAHRLRFMPDDLTKLSVGFRMVELTRALSEPGDPQPLLFNALVHSLLHVDAATARIENVLPHFQLRLASALGFAPRIDRQVLDEIGDEGGELDLTTGAARPASGGDSTRPASRVALRAFAVFARADLETALQMRLTEKQFDETLSLVDTYLRHHVGSPYPDRADTVARQLSARIRS